MRATILPARGRIRLSIPSRRLELSGPEAERLAAALGYAAFDLRVGISPPPASILIARRRR